MSFLDKKNNRILISVLWVIAFIPTLSYDISGIINGFDLFSLLQFLNILICTVFLFINLLKTPYNFTWVIKWAAIYYLISALLLILDLICSIIAYHSPIGIYVTKLLANILPVIYLFSFKIKKPKITLALFVIAGIASLIQFIYHLNISYNVIYVFLDSSKEVLLLVPLGLLMLHKEPWVCPVCLYSNRPKAKFCGRCGRQKDFATAPNNHQPQ